MLSVILMNVDLNESESNKFEELYYKYRKRLFSCAFSILKNNEDSEDVLQNAFIKIAQNIKCIAELESKETAAFLTVIVKNCAYDFLRKYSDYTEPLTEETENISVNDNSIEELVDKLEYEKIVSVIKNIPSPYNEVLYIHFVKDYSLKKTAVILGRKTATVKMQLVRGKKILVEKLREALYD
ncbi:MAG: sigma-70 family RNA polymerase sigma factor [Clostridia bacterium]|nr:sigma-70 family RNA polymerase sigma factor [Clostridia bacterium]